MERLSQHLRVEICQYLDGADIVNVYEAMSNMKSVLGSPSIKGILRSYVRQMELVDARLCCMLYSTSAVAKKEAESVVNAQSEGNVLCSAIRYYQECCQFTPGYISHVLSNRGRIVRFLVFGCSVVQVCSLHQLWFGLRYAASRCGRPLQRKYHIGADLIESVFYLTKCEVHINYESIGDEHHRTFETPYLRAFDGVVYMIDSAVQCQVGRILPLGLRRLIFRITNLAAIETGRYPMLLILDGNSRETEDLTSKGEHFEHLIVSLHRLDRLALGGFGGPAARLQPYNWWRVCRLHQQNGRLMNLYEAFLMAALQIVKTNAGRSSQVQNVPSNPFASQFG